MNLSSSRKGLFGSVIAIIIVLFVFGVVTMFSHVFLINFTDTLQTIDATNTTIITEAGDKFVNALEMYDYIVVFLVLAMIIGMAITSYKVASAPVFAVMIFIEAVFLGVISYLFNHLFFNIMSNSAMASTVAVYPRTMILLTNLHWIALIALAVGAIALFGKKEKGQFL